MGQRRGNALSARVAEVGERIENWRRTRTKRSPMPEDLWEAATSLARAHGVHPIARALRLQHNYLRDRVNAVGERRGENERDVPGFIELRSLEAVGTAQPSGPVVEFSHRDGTKLTVRLTASNELDLSGLAMSFFRRRS